MRICVKDATPVAKCYKPRPSARLITLTPTLIIPDIKFNQVQVLVQVYLLRIIYLVDFLKTNLTKFAVICVTKRQKAGFLSPRSSKIIVTKKKERRKRKSEEKERRRREKSNGCTLSFWPEKTVGHKRSTQR